MKTLNQTPAAPAQAQHSPLTKQTINAYDELRAHAQRLADALNKAVARLDFVTRHSDFSTKDNDAITQGREALAEWSKSI